MRIISGAAKGRRLAAPKGLDIRPTTDFVKEAMFQLLENQMAQPWQECTVLDLFAGSGALGIEALSRGAAHCIFLDSSFKAATLIQRNLQICGEPFCLPHRATVCITDLFRLKGGCSRLLWAHRPFQVIFADPPYETGLSLATIHFVVENDLLGPNGILVVEERKGIEVAMEPPLLKKGGLIALDRRIYGDTALWFYQKDDETQKNNSKRQHIYMAGIEIRDMEQKEMG